MIDLTYRSRFKLPETQGDFERWYDSFALSGYGTIYSSYICALLEELAPYKGWKLEVCAHGFKGEKRKCLKCHMVIPLDKP